MKFRLLIAVGSCFSFLGMKGQNLVPNPSFEIHSSCPDNQDQINRATPWVRPTANTPDYYNACTSSFVDVPVNWFGTEYAHTGNAYSGFAAFYGGNSKEYVEAPLLDTLKTGRTYCVSFYISLADSSYDGIAPIGAYFSNAFYNNQGQIDNIAVTPQVNSALQIPFSDTSGWTLISGSFVANGTENYIIIGCFSPDSLLARDSTIRPRPFSYLKGAYYYLDDVSVIEIADCHAGNDGTICLGDSLPLGILPDTNISYSWSPAAGLSDPNISNPKASPEETTTYTLTQTQCDMIQTSSVTVTMMQDCDAGAHILIPSILNGDEQLKITGLKANSTLEIFDMRGRLIYKDVDYENDFGLLNLAQGMYLIRLTWPNGEMKVQKLVVR